MGPAHSPSLFCGIFFKKGRKMSGGCPWLFHFKVFGLLFCSTVFSNRDDLDEFMKISPMPGPNLKFGSAFFKEPRSHGNFRKFFPKRGILRIPWWISSDPGLIDAMSSGGNLPVVRRRPMSDYMLKLTAFFYTWKMDCLEDEDCFVFFWGWKATWQVLFVSRWCILLRKKVFKSLTTIFAY